MSKNTSHHKHLVHNYSIWKNKETCTIRVPKVIKEDVIAIAHKLDKGEYISENRESNVIVALKELMDKVNNEEKGYKDNSASRLIKQLKSLIEDV